VHILHHAAKKAVYGRWMLQELAEHGHHVSPGTLYPALARMERNGWLKSTATDRPNARRNYRITRAGQQLLDQLRSDLNELHREVVLGIEPSHASALRRSRIRATPAQRAPSYPVNVSSAATRRAQPRRREDR
jgi:DNA-binding PadR family transcriptional regulator